MYIITYNQTKINKVEDFAFVNEHFKSKIQKN